MPITSAPLAAASAATTELIDPARHGHHDPARRGRARQVEQRGGARGFERDAGRRGGGSGEVGGR